ncbi:MAG: hypothetical protein LBF62_09635 [Tannerellaceae bacterium]|jgi:hypothetical protein|nr:hypothetical protein [Tannerellaceae bacterium]
MNRITQRLLVFFAIPAMFVILSGGCRKSLNEFSFSYSMESVNYYKTAVSFYGNKTWKIETHNYYMDNHAGKREPAIREGTLTEEEYKTLKTLLTKCNFSKVEDSYGFDKDAGEYIDDLLIYQVHFQTPEKNKFISIRALGNHTYPLPFINLLIYVNTFLEEHKEFARED